MELYNEDNLEELSELSNPELFACLKMITEFAENKDMKNSANILKNFIKDVLKFSISKNRKGRLEHIQSSTNSSPMQQIDEDKQLKELI